MSRNVRRVCRIVACRPRSGDTRSRRDYVWVGECGRIADGSGTMAVTPLGSLPADGSKALAAFSNSPRKMRISRGAWSASVTRFPATRRTSTVMLSPMRIHSPDLRLSTSIELISPKFQLPWVIGRPVLIPVAVASGDWWAISAIGVPQPSWLATLRDLSVVSCFLKKVYVICRLASRGSGVCLAAPHSEILVRI